MHEMAAAIAGEAVRRSACPARRLRRMVALVAGLLGAILVLSFGGGIGSAFASAPVMSSVTGCAHCSTDWGTQQVFDDYYLLSNPSATSVPYTQTYGDAPQGLNPYSAARAFVNDVNSNTTGADTLGQVVDSAGTDALGVGGEVAGEGFLAGMTSIPVIGLAAADAWLVWHDAGLVMQILEPGYGSHGSGTNVLDVSQSQAQPLSAGHAVTDNASGFTWYMPYDGFVMEYLSSRSDTFQTPTSSVCGTAQLNGWTMYPTGFTTQCVDGSLTGHAAITPETVKSGSLAPYTGQTANYTSPAPTAPPLDGTYATAQTHALNANSKAATEVEKDLKPIVIPLPTSGGQAASDYANILTSLGLSPQVSVAPIPTYDQSTGAVEDVNPGVGQQVAPGATVKVLSVPPTSDKENPACRLSAPASTDVGASRGFDWRSPGDFVWQARFTPYDGSLGDDPSAALGASLQRNTGTGTTSVNFLWGWESQDLTQGWGYRHIKVGHGWSPADRSATQAALQATPVSGNPADPTARLRYVGPSYVQNQTQCWRVVVVAPLPVQAGPLGAQVTDPTAKGIITSFGASQISGP